MKDFKQIENLLKDKDIALVGNSKSVLGQKFPVDNHEVIIRMNGAWNLPRDMQESVGNRLDILCISALRKEIDKITQVHQNVIWMSPKSRDLLSQETTDALFFYPREWWEELYSVIGARPSTGCMVVDMIKRLIGAGHLTLYGFDFFANPSWHKKYSLKERIKLLLGKEIYVNPHDGTKEAEYIQSALPTTQFSIVKTK